MPDLTNLSDDQLFTGSGEQSGSQMSYQRDIEIRRRLYLLERDLLERQTEGVAAQREATKAQDAAVAEMRTQSRLMLASVAGIFLTAIATAFLQ